MVYIGLDSRGVTSSGDSAQPILRACVTQPPVTVEIPSTGTKAMLTLDDVLTSGKLWKNGKPMAAFRFSMS
jgi:hypothetical protein